MTAVARDATLRARLAAAGRARILARFSFDRVLENLQAVYRSAYEERVGRR